MAGLEILKAVVLAVILVAPAASQAHMELITDDNWRPFHLPSTRPVITEIKFSKDTNTSYTQACFQMDYSNDELPFQDCFKIGQEDEKKRIIVIMLYNTVQTVPGGNPTELESRVVSNMLTGLLGTITWKIQNIAVWSEKPVRWQVFHNDLSFWNISTHDSSASAMNTAFPSTCPSPFLSPALTTLASLCVLLALSTLVLSILLCLKYAPSKNGLGQAASFSDPTTFKSTEALVNDQVYFPYNHSGRGSLHISENSLYGVI